VKPVPFDATPRARTGKNILQRKKTEKGTKMTETVPGATCVG
jgi:hypothetical protein